jgi:ribose 1,5-bisphosphokinase
MSAPQTQSARTQAPIGPGRFILVVGPSGAGKDTIIAGAKAARGGDPSIVFPRRVVTRPASEAEDHDTLASAAFDGAVKDGAFAFWWEAHGLKYGIPRAADDNIRAGRVVVCNVSRAVVAEVRARYAHVEAVTITAPADVLAARLAGRSRGTDGSLAQRVDRNNAFTDFRADHVIENIATPEAAVQMLLGVISGAEAPSA